MVRGLSQEYHEKTFGAFQRLRGRGRALRGRIRVESAAGRGATFLSGCPSFRGSGESGNENTDSCG